VTMGDVEVGVGGERQREDGQRVPRIRSGETRPRRTESV
jgi:hypothetical protein